MLRICVAVDRSADPNISPSLLASQSVCPDIKAYISIAIRWILMKLGESVGTWVQLIVLKFH